MSDLEIKREEVLPGDYIRVSYEEYGVLTVRSGKVARSANSISTDEGGTLWHFMWEGTSVFELIDRPKPQLPTEAGSLVFARIIEGTQDTLALRADGWWMSLATGRFYKASEVTDHPWRLAKVILAEEAS
jgi:hypothetical protein